MRKSVDLWWEHTEVTAGKGKVGKPVSKTLNVSVAILNLMHHSTGSQRNCCRR